MRFLLILSILFVLNCGKNDFLVPEVEAQTGEQEQELHSAETIELKGYDKFDKSLFLSGTGNIVLKRGSEERIIISIAEGYGEILIYDNQMTPIVILDYEGVRLFFGGRIKIDEKYVLGPQQQAIADASGPTDTERKLNLLLEACREHGLIARGEQIALSEK